MARSPTKGSEGTRSWLTRTRNPDSVRSRSISPGPGSDRSGRRHGDDDQLTTIGQELGDVPVELISALWVEVVDVVEQHDQIEALRRFTGPVPDVSDVQSDSRAVAGAMEFIAGGGDDVL
jgi:hypothetical protein